MSLHLRPVLAVFALTASMLCQAQTFSLQNDFSITSNPNGNWAFGSGNSPSAFDLYTNNTNVGQLYSGRGQNGLVGWSVQTDAFPAVDQNQSSTTWYQTWHPGDVVVHPGAPGYSIVRWYNTIPGPTTVHLDTSFRRVEDATSFVSDWYVVVNGTTQASGTLLTLNQQTNYSNTFVLGPGDYIAFAVGYEVDQAGTDLNVNATINAAAIQKVSGHVNLQNFSASPSGIPVTVKIRNVGSTTDLDSQTVSLDSSGNFTITTNVGSGNFDIAVKGPHWLRKNLANQTLGQFGATGLSFSLINGDINGDNHITLGDFAQLRAAFGSSPGGGNWNPNADLNGDGAVTLGDFAILRSNFGLDGDD